MDTEKQIRGFLYHRTNLSVIKNFGHTCLFKSLPRHLLEATGCRLCFGPAVKYGPEHNPHPVLLKSFWRQDLKSSFQEQFNHSVASYSSGLDILQSIKQQWKSLSWCSIWRSYLFWCSKVEILYASVPKCNGKSDDWCLHIFSSLRKEWNMDGQKFGRCPHSLWKSLKKVSFDNISADFLTKKISCIQLIFKPQKQAEFSWYFSTGKQAQFSWT